MQNVLNVMVDRRHAVEPLLEKRDQDPRHRSIIITPQLLKPERCLAQPGQMGPQNQVTGNRVNRDLSDYFRFNTKTTRELGDLHTGNVQSEPRLAAAKRHAASK